MGFLLRLPLPTIFLGIVARIPSIMGSCFFTVHLPKKGSPSIIIEAMRLASFIQAKPPLGEEDSIIWVEAHELSQSVLIGGDKPPPSLVSVCKRFLFPCFLDDLPPSYRGELHPLIRTLFGDPVGGFLRDLKPKGCLNSVLGWERWSQFTLFL